MIRLILSHLEEAHADDQLSWRQLCEELPYSTVMRWRSRANHGDRVLCKRGPKKTDPMDWEHLYALIATLRHGRSRTHGTTKLHALLHTRISRRQVRRVAAQIRQSKLDEMKRIQWLVA